jgi:hypothetical protein
VAIKSADLVALADQQLGKPYVFGAEGPNTFDCSGLMQWVYGRFGVKLPRLAHEQATYGIAVPKSGPYKPGDLVFSSWDGRPSSHVGMYVGNNQIINAPQPGERVKLSTLTSGYLSHVDAVRRVPGVDGVAAPATGPGGGFNPLDPFGVGGDLAGAVKGIGDSLASTVGAFQSAGRLAELLLKLALPSSMVRIASGVLGAIFLFWGIFFLVREVRK